MKIYSRVTDEKHLINEREKVPSDADVQITSADSINDVLRNIKRRNEEQIETETTEQDGEITEQHEPRQRKRISALTQLRTS